MPNLDASDYIAIAALGISGASLLFTFYVHRKQNQIDIAQKKTELLNSFTELALQWRKAQYQLYEVRDTAHKLPENHPKRISILDWVSNLDKFYISSREHIEDLRKSLTKADSINSVEEIEAFLAELYRQQRGMEETLKSGESKFEELKAAISNVQ